MRKGITYLLFGALILGNSFTLPFTQQSQTEESNLPRVVYGTSGISTAIALKSDPQVKEALVYETETTSTVEEQETAKNEETATSNQTEKESAPNKEVDEESESEQIITDENKNDKPEIDSTQKPAKKEVPKPTVKTDETEPVVTEEKEQDETESDSTEKVLKKEKPQEIEKNTSSFTDDSTEVTAETEDPPSDAQKDTAKPVEEETAPELSLYEEEKMVLNQVIAQLDFNAEGHQFFLSKMDENLYQVEIRHSNPQGDVEISNMVGLYRYHLETGTLSVMDPITGEFN